MIDCFIFKDCVFPCTRLNNDIFTAYEKKQLPPIFSYYVSLNSYYVSLNKLPIEIRRDECIFTDMKTLKDEYPEIFI